MLRSRRLVQGLAALAVLILLGVARQPASGEDAVILMDGFTIRGKSFKEKAVTFDALSGPLVFNRLNAFDGVDQGPKYVFFSGHTKKQLAAIEKDIPKDKELEFTRPNPGSINARLPSLGSMTIGDFKDNWRRTIKVNLPGGQFEVIEQQLTYMSPSRIYINSITHSWRQAFATREFAPAVVRKLLSTHPQLKDEGGSVNPKRRMLIAEFMKDVGWLSAAREELDLLKKDSKGPWEKETQERFDRLNADINKAETALILEELEAALGAGRYRFSAQFLERYQPKSSDAKDLAKFAEFKARIEIVQPRHELARRLLRELIDQETGVSLRLAWGSAAGGLSLPGLPPKKLSDELAVLTTAAETVWGELHPDSVARVELFVDLANQAEQRRQMGKDPGAKADRLLALAVTGWLKGKNGAEQDPKNAVRCWNTRQLATNYLLEEGQNTRTQMLQSYLNSPDRLPPDELAQLISVLPPIRPEDLTSIKSQSLDPKLTQGISEIVRRSTGNSPADGNVRYALRLPPEYHHGRSYPVVLALTTPGLEPEKMVAGLAADAARFGYLVAAIEWDERGLNKAYDYSGLEHRKVQAVLRDLGRRFAIDPDRVFLFGFGEGANFAMDMGMSHPDLFAGVVAMGPTLLGPFFQEYWRNGQKLPVYSVIGELSGPAFESLRKIYEKWLPLGYPGLMTVYKGRPNEWFANEVPTIFEWMNRKTRVRGTASLRLNATRFEPWQSMRDSDRRFYWVEFGTLSPFNTMKYDRPQIPPTPAQFRADISKGNDIVITDLRGVRKLTIWLERDMIDWTKKVSISVPSSKTPWKPKELTPDPRVMFEHLYETGDRKMLFFGKLDFEIFGG